MQLAGQMDGAAVALAAADGVPACRIGNAEELGRQPNLFKSGRHRHALKPLGQGPGGAAGRPANHLQAPQLCLRHLDAKQGLTETLSVATQADRPGQGASGGRGQDRGQGGLFAGGNDGDFLVGTQNSQVI